MPAGGQGLLEVADLLDDDLPAGGLAAFGFFGGVVGSLPVGFGDDPDQVGMVAGDAPQAVFAAAAGVAVRAGPGAQHPGRQGFGEVPLAAAGRAREEQRVGHPAGAVEHPLPEAGLPLEDHRKHTAVTIASTSARISSGLRLASIRRTRRGSAAARRR